MSPTCPRAALGLALLALLLAAVAVPAGAQDLDSTEERIEALREDLDAATARYEQIHDRLDRAEERLAGLREEARRLERRVARLDDALITRARALYMQGTDSTLATLVAAEEPGELADRATMLAVLQSRDQGRLEASRSLRAQLGQTRTLLADTRDELEQLRTQLERQRSDLQARLQRAQELARRLRSREARRRRIERGVQSGIYSCIFDPGAASFHDTWGAPRSGGRRHQGTDVFAAYGAPVYAFTDGVVSRLSSGGLGGISVYLRGDDGNVYYYAHLSGYADSLYTGKRVTAGEHIAYNGGSGNASRSAPHVHFELKPGGGTEINPYPWMVAACR